MSPGVIKSNSTQNATMTKGGKPTHTTTTASSPTKSGSGAPTFSKSTPKPETPVDATPATKETKVVDTINALISATTSDARQSSIDTIIDIVKSESLTGLTAHDIIGLLTPHFTSKKSVAAREGSALLIHGLSKAFSPAINPYLVSTFPTLLELVGDKQASVREAASLAVNQLISTVHPYALDAYLPAIYAGLDYSSKWQTKEICLLLLVTLVAQAAMPLRAHLPEIIPLVSECMWDTKDNVKVQAKRTMASVCSLVANKDIEDFIPALIDCISAPENVPETIHLLGATTFVSPVEAPTLAIMCPLLSRALSERATPIRRKTAVIIENMCKLVDDPHLAAPFLPKLYPGLEKLADEVSDPECRSVVERAHALLDKISAAHQANPPKKLAEPKTVQKNLTSLLSKPAPASLIPSVTFVSQTVAALMNAKNYSPDVWTSAIAPYISAWISDKASAEDTASKLLKKCEVVVEDEFDADSDSETPADAILCNTTFSLAYGAKVLLNTAVLRLIRGRRYGLVGPNGAGKSTLMRAIANGQVEGFPSQDEVKTCYVEHDIDGTEADTPVLDFVTSDSTIAKTTDEIKSVLESVGFKDAMLTAPIASLSGGWKMKLALARAMLREADIMLLDEPTNHLDVINVKWVEDYLCSLKNVTSIVVSHDSSFLDTVCTDIIHYHSFKLRRYKGNLSAFVARVPEAKSYYDLAAASQAFKFPEPGFLEGVKTKERAILKVKDAAYQYPNTPAPQIKDITFQCSLSSRVAVIGPNGAGKSTLIKMLTGEVEPISGTVWKHPNLRIAYVAQHAFHHIEQHLDKTANEYIQWRYATGEDREELQKVSRTISEEEEKAMAKVHVIDGAKRVVDQILRRRKLKNSYEYEVSWMNTLSDQNSWLPRKVLEDMGLQKKMNEVDAAEAARQGLTRPLTQREIEAHIAAIGLEPEFATHSRMRGLSGGQKVKVVIAAAMWNRPHMLVLDEPTNYLDRDSLGALASAIREYEGGVVMITHNRQFSESLCTEVWAVSNGTLTPSGHNWVTGNGSGPRIVEKEQGDMVDAAGNTVESQRKVKLTGKDLRKKKKDRMARRKRGEEVFSDEDDF